MDGHLENLDLAEESLGNPMVAASIKLPSPWKIGLLITAITTIEILNPTIPRNSVGPNSTLMVKIMRNSRNVTLEKGRHDAIIVVVVAMKESFAKRLLIASSAPKRGTLLRLDCPNKNVGVDFSSRLCLKCGRKGHDMFSCANRYDPEDLKKGWSSLLCRRRYDQRTNRSFVLRMWAVGPFWSVRNQMKFPDHFAINVK